MMRVEPVQRISSISPTQRRNAKVIVTPVKAGQDAETEEDALLQLFDDYQKAADKVCVIVLWLSALYICYHLVKWWLG